MCRLLDGLQPLELFHQKGSTTMAIKLVGSMTPEQTEKLAREVIEAGENE